MRFVAVVTVAPLGSAGLAADPACATAVPLLAKLCRWSWSWRDEVVKLEWSMLRGVEGEHHFEIEGKLGVRKWFRIPDGLFKDLAEIRTTSRNLAIAKA